MATKISYRLLDSLNNVLTEWSGGAGVEFDPPNPIFLPNDIQVHAPVLDQDYFGYRLVRVEETVPDPSPPTLNELTAKLNEIQAQIDALQNGT